MSKSKGEFLTLSRLEELGYSPMVYKFFCLQSHYRKQLVYSEEALDSAKSAYEKLIKRLTNLTDDNSAIDKEKFNELNDNFKAALGNDLNTSFAITVVFDVLKSDTTNNTKIALIKEFDKVLGLEFANALEKKQEIEESNNANIDEQLKKHIEEMIEKRKLAKQQKDYATADAIRNELISKGIELIDTKEGTTYKLK